MVYIGTKQNRFLRFVFCFLFQACGFIKQLTRKIFITEKVFSK